jgi:hypothetical protein
MSDNKSGGRICAFLDKVISNLFELGGRAISSLDLEAEHLGGRIQGSRDPEILRDPDNRFQTVQHSLLCSPLVNPA